MRKIFILVLGPNIKMFFFAYLIVERQMFNDVDNFLFMIKVIRNLYARDDIGKTPILYNNSPQTKTEDTLR